MPGSISSISFSIPGSMGWDKPFIWDYGNVTVFLPFVPILSHIKKTPAGVFYATLQCSEFI